MSIVVTGGTGFIGRNVCKAFAARNIPVICHTRSEQRVEQVFGGLASPTIESGRIRGIEDLGELKNENIRAIVNLAGQSLDSWWWTEQQKAKLTASRVNTTNEVVGLIRNLGCPPPALVSGSAIGYYGFQKDGDTATLTESSPPADQSFTHQLCHDWEAAAWSAKAEGSRVCTLRIGIVLDKDGGALQKMALPFKLGLGGPIGSGEQMMSWIHLQDMVRLIEFCVDNDNVEGPINATAPLPVSNLQFTKALGSALNRPTVLFVPGFALSASMGEMGDLVLKGQNVVPEKAKEAGFRFKFDRIDDAFNNIFK